MLKLTKLSTNRIQRLLMNFYRLTGCKVCVFDSDGTEIYYYPEKFSLFCGYIRGFDKFNVECHDCDINNMINIRKCRSICEHICHAGLIECFSPIIVEREIIGFVAVGQTRRQNSVLPNCEQYEKEGLDMQRVLRFYEKLPVLDEASMDASICILEASIGFELLKDKDKNSDKMFVKEVDRYIQSNITTELSVDEMCRAFYISRRELYKRFDTLFGCTPAKYIKRRRLSYAKELLQEEGSLVTKVAVKCGIGDYNYFTKLFKKEYGITPKKLADKYKNNK